MEMKLQFSELSMKELECVEGGNGKQAAAVGAGTLMISWAPVAAFIPGIGWAAAGCLTLTGAALIGKGTGAY